MVPRHAHLPGSIVGECVFPDTPSPVTLHLLPHHLLHYDHNSPMPVHRLRGSVLPAIVTASLTIRAASICPGNVTKHASGHCRTTLLHRKGLWRHAYDRA